MTELMLGGKACNLIEKNFHDQWHSRICGTWMHWTDHCKENQPLCSMSKTSHEDWQVDYVPWLLWVGHFWKVNDFTIASSDDIPIQVLDEMKEHLKLLKNVLRTYFLDLHRLRMGSKIPSYLVILAYHQAKKIDWSEVRWHFERMTFEKNLLTDFWFSVHTEIPSCGKQNHKYSMSFATVYFCQAGFPILLDLKLTMTWN
jgi:hypothetical protein